MMKIFRYLGVAFIAGITSIPQTNVLAGNDDRAGQAGASELLINPWARSSGWGNTNTACSQGLESMYSNIAGLAFTKKTELLVSNTQYLVGTGININSFGFSQRIGKTGVVGGAMTMMNFGDMLITTTELPEGGIGSFSPSFMNINLAYAKEFSNSIRGGINFKVISESISDVRGQGAAVDAGIQYVTGELENIKFGIALKNVGPRMKYSGDGLTFRGFVPGAPNAMTLAQRSAEFELPSSLHIGAAYDFYISKKVTEPETKSKKKGRTVPDHRITVAGNYVSNSFVKDNFALGLEYCFKELVQLRAGYTYEKGITNHFKTQPRMTFLTGPSAGFTILVPLNKERTSHFELDYSFRATNPYAGIHCIGARVNL